MSMKRSQSRAASPTPTAFSGISNYRTDSYRPIKDKNVPAVPNVDYRLVSKVHFEELKKYLAVYLSQANASARTTARKKLTRLTIQQFHELSTDVYDELVRRKNDTEVPFLPVREDFHPKRNQARQKLATLPTSRFEDLSSDVYFELAGRYPEFQEDPSGGRASSSSNYDDYPAPDFPKNGAARQITASRTSGRMSADRPTDGGYGSVTSRRPSEDRRRPSESGRRSTDTYGGRTSDDNYMSPRAQRRKPSQDTTRRSEDREREYTRRPSAAASLNTNSDTTTNTNAQSATATSGMIIPNKSTMEEEYIEVPYGRDARESSSTTERDSSRDRNQDNGLTSALTEDIDSSSDYPSPMSPPIQSSGLGGLSARLMGVDDEDEDIKGRDQYHTRSNSANMVNRFTNGRPDDPEKMKRDYEYKIASMQTQISNLQRDLGDSNTREQNYRDGEAKVRQMEEELVGLRQRVEEQSSAMRSLQRELEDLKESREREQERAALRMREDKEEIQILKARCELLEDERGSGGGAVNSEIVGQLQQDMQGLFTELEDLSRRNDELMAAKDADLVVTRDLENQVKEYKRKYEQAKTELRSVKATSQLFLQAPKTDKMEDQLPVSPDGGILDIHITAFLSAIDSLLTAGRTDAPPRVLAPMKSVVNAVTSIVDDIRAFERRPQRDRPDVDVDALKALRERAETTLSNLVAASTTHAMSSGMSPVSLLDAAASHVSATVTEMAKTVFIRRATKGEQAQLASSTPYSPAMMSNGGFSPVLRNIDEAMHQRKASSSSNRYTNDNAASSRFGDYRRRTPSEQSSSEHTDSPPPIFDQPLNGGPVSDDSTGIEDNWTELKPYLEAQTESIVYAIQSVLSGVRSPTPSPTLNENLTQIITIVSSIVAVCKDNLPPASAQQGSDILRDLSDHAMKLSEVQALPEVTKESRQIMAKSSFAVANAMKGLMKL